MVRFKNRWLLVEFIPIPIVGPTAENNNLGFESDFDGKQIYSAIKQSVLANYGDVGWGAVGLSLTVKYYSPQTNICIIRVARDHHKIAWGAITMLGLGSGSTGKRVGCIPHVVHVSGTIKQAQIAAISHNRQVIAKYKANAKGVDTYDAYLESSTTEIEALQD